MGAFGTTFVRIVDHGPRFWTIFVHVFQDFGSAFGLLRASAVAGSPLCGALDSYFSIFSIFLYNIGPHGGRAGGPYNEQP